MNETEAKLLLEAVYRLVDQAIERFDALRDTDRAAVALAHNDLSDRLEGYPQLFATKTELDEAIRTLRRLETEAISREIYEGNQKVAVETLSRLENDKLAESVFATFVENYRLEQVRDETARRDAAEILAKSMSDLRETLREERGDFITEDVYEKDKEDTHNEVDGVKRWQYLLTGGLVFATFVAPTVTGVIVYYLTRA